MKNSLLWKSIERRYGTRIRALFKGGETGAAMVMALIFIMIVTMTSLLLLGVLVAQAVPYVKGSQSTQAGYAAETGLQVAKSYLNKMGNSLPTVSEASSGPSSTFTLATSTDGTYNYVTATGTVSSTSTGATLYSPKNVSYTIKIGYFAADPSGSSDNPLSTTLVSSAKYAVIISTGQAGGTTNTTLKSVSAIYKLTDSTTSVFPSKQPATSAFTVSNNDATQKYADVPDPTDVTTDDNDDIDTVTTGVFKWRNDLASDSSSVSRISDPRATMCLVASTDSDGNIDTSHPYATAGSVVRIFRAATLTSYDSTSQKSVFTYSDYCKHSGAYSRLNKWVYGNDDSIRLASDTTLCITGTSTDATSDQLATLQKCGNNYYSSTGESQSYSAYMTNPNGYSPKMTGTKVNWLNGDTGYAASNELADNSTDSKSLLNSYQKWGFYGAFINAGYLSKTTSGSWAYSTGSVTADSRFQVLYASHKSSLNRSSGCGNAVDNPTQYDDSGDDACYLISSKWDSSSLKDTGVIDDASQTLSESLGMSGEAGWETGQVTSSTGACVSIIKDNDSRYVVTKQCNINAAPLRSFCNQNAFKNSSTSGSWTSECLINDDNWESASDYMSYAKGTSTTTSVDSSGSVTTTEGTPTKTTLGTYWDWGTAACYAVQNATAGAVLQLKQGSCSDSDPLETFYRYEYMGEDSIYNYKFVLASSTEDGQTPLCLTQTTPEDSRYLYSTLPNNYRGSAYITLQECTNKSKNVYGGDSYPQEWNAPIYSIVYGTASSGETSTGTEIAGTLYSIKTLSSSSTGWWKD